MYCWHYYYIARKFKVLLDIAVLAKRHGRTLERRTYLCLQKKDEDDDGFLVFVLPYKVMAKKLGFQLVVG